MAAPAYKVRRATLEDLPALRELWTKANFSLPDLEKRFTEVQLAEGDDGKIAGAIGMKVDRLHGLIHSEAILDKTNTALYEAIWQRFQILARNFGLFRLWTESTTPYWQTLGFKAPEDKTYEKRPEAITTPKEELLTLALKEESADGLSVEQQFEIFTQSQKQETERLMQQAQTFKKIAYAVLAVACGLFVIIAVARLLKLPQLRKGR